jgi:pyruvate-ferredoxin/flavodoxin oxidoreductase
MGEVRYSSLTRTFPENAERLFKKAEDDVKERYELYKRMAAQAEASGETVGEVSA